jgi:hypothetical protein
MTNEVSPSSGNRDASRASRRFGGIAARLPNVAEMLPDALAKRVAAYPATSGHGLSQEELECAAEVAGFVRALLARPVTKPQLGEWVALVMAGTRKMRTDHETHLFMAALGFACEDMPAAVFCEETQRMAMRSLVFAPSVAEILAVVDPIVRDWQRTRDALEHFVLQAALAEHAAAQDTPPELPSHGA